MAEEPVYAERMFQFRRPGHSPAGPWSRRSPTARRRGSPAGAARGSAWYWRRVGVRPGVQGITVYPPTGGVQTQGDPFEPVKIGILIDMDLNQLLADWIDPTMLALEDAPTRAYCGGRSSSSWPTPAGCRGVELPQGDRRLPLARRAGLRRRARPDDLGQLAGPPGHRQRAGRQPASAGPAPTASPPSTASPWPTATSPPRASCAPSGWRPAASPGSARSGSRARGAATTPTTSGTRPGSWGSPCGGQARAQPPGPARRPGHDADLGVEGLYYGATATPRSTSPRRCPPSAGTRPG